MTKQETGRERKCILSCRLVIKTKLNTAIFMFLLTTFGRCSFSPKRIWISKVLCCISISAGLYESMISDIISFLQMSWNGQNRRKCSTLPLLSPHLQSGEDVSELFIFHLCSERVEWPVLSILILLSMAESEEE